MEVTVDWRHLAARQVPSVVRVPPLINCFTAWIYVYIGWFCRNV